MAEVTIGDRTYPSLSSYEEALDYNEANLGASDWRDAEEDDQKRAVVSASRMFAVLEWAGEKTDGYSELPWPRKNTGIEGVTDDEIPQPILDGVNELAAALISNPELASTPAGQQAVRRLKAGSVEIENFRIITGAGGEVTRLPLSVLELIGPYLSGDGESVEGGYASGTCGRSAFRRPYKYNQPL